VKRDCGHDSPSGLTCKCGMTWCPDCYDKHICPEPLPPLWPTQERGIQAIRNAFRAGHRRILVTAPCGAGKTLMMAMIARGVQEKSRRAIIYSNRRMLTTQTSRKLHQAGVDHGMFLSGERMAFLRDVQVASIQTVHSWLKRKKIELHPADAIMIDEPHAQKGEMMRSLMAQHLEQGAVIIGFTATPVDLGGYYDVLVEAGTKQDLREIGALVPARTFGPDEPDLRHVGIDKLVYTVGEQTEAIIRPKVFGRIWDNWSRLQRDLFGVLNLQQDARPTVLFAPGVPHSRWFAERFEHRGVAAAHIDATTPDDERAEIEEGSRDGRIKVVCNRFLLREGIDWPWIEHMILACVMGSIQTWVQATGRGLRACPDVGKQFVIVQDHGGHWHRHGDINDDIDWVLSDTSVDVHRKRREAVQSGEVKEDFRCPQCGEIIKPYDLQHFGGCPHCGKKFKRSVREVVQVDGTLKRMYGPARPRRRKHPVKMDSEKLWDKCFWGSMRAKRKMTLEQTKMWFYSERHKRGMGDAQPPYGAWNCPEQGSIDWTRYVREVYAKYVK